MALTLHSLQGIPTVGAQEDSAPARRASQDPEKEDAQPTLIVEELEFEGNTVFSDAQLRESFELEEAGILHRLFRRRPVYTRDRYNLAAAGLLQYLTNQGYLRAVIGEPRIRFINPADAAKRTGDVPIRLIVPVTEGPLHRLGELRVQGGTVLLPEQIRARFDIQSGDVIRAELLERELNRLRQQYGRQGYLQFAPTIDFGFKPAPNNEAVTDIVITLNEGPQFTLGQLDFSGNFRTRDLPLRRIIPLNEGDIFDYARLEEGLDRLNRTGLFEPLTPANVVLNFDAARGVADVVLRLVERDVQRIDLSGGGGTTGGFNLGLDYSNANLTGRIDDVLARIRVGNFEKAVSGQYGLTLLTARPLTLSFAGGYQQFEFVNARETEGGRPLYVQASTNLRVGATIPLSRERNSMLKATSAGLFYSLSITSLEDLLAGRVQNVNDIEQSGIRQATLSPIVIHDTLERGFDPRRGRRFTLGLDWAARALGGTYNLLGPGLDFRQFIPLNQGLVAGEPNVLGFRFRAAHNAGYGRPLDARALTTFDGIPLFNRFFLGGETEVRGYQINSISPMVRVDRLLEVGNNPPVLVASEVRPIGGDTQIVANLEYSAPLLNRVSGAAYFDFGAAFNARRTAEQRFVSPVELTPPVADAFLTTVVRPLSEGAEKFPPFRISLGVELRLLVPVANFPLRLIFAYNPNAIRNPPPATLLAPERRFVFRIGFGRTL